MSTIRASRSLLTVLLCSVFVLLPMHFVSAQDATSNTQTKVDGVEVRYAQKRVELAKADFEIAVAQNRRTPVAYSQLSLLRLQNQVSQAELLLEHALQKKPSDPHQIHIKCLEGSVELAKRQFDWVSEFSKKIPDMFPQDQVKRFYLNAELAQLALERAKHPKVTNSPMDHFQWQIDQLQSEVLMLQLELERVKSGK